MSWSTLRRGRWRHAQLPDTDTALSDLELLAAIAVALGMSHNIVIKASQINRDRIDALLDHHSDRLKALARSYVVVLSARS